MKMALEGVRVLDMTQAWAGATCTKLLGDMGAEVLKMESSKRMDGTRGQPNAQPGGAGVYPDNIPGERPWNRSGYFNERNRSKLGICLDLTDPKGIAVFKRLVAVSDVVVENYRFGVMERLGLEYSALQKIRPDIVMISLSSQGGTGPERYYGSYGMTLEQTGGLAAVTGYLGGEPTTSGTFFPDPLVAVLGAGLVTAALSRRSITGEGAYIDLSQREATTCIIGESIMDYTMNGRIQGPMGNRDPLIAPQAVYRCRGEDMWIAISIRSDAEWKIFCGVIGRLELALDARYVNVGSRHANHDHLDQIIEQWTRERDPLEATTILQQAGIAAGAALKGDQLLADSHLNARGFWEIVEHPEAGTHPYLSRPFKFSKTPGKTRYPAPLLGEHTEYVLRGILHLSEEEIRELEASGVTSNLPIGVAPES